MLSRLELKTQLERSGLKDGDTVMLHAAYKSMGGIEGGIESLIESLLEVVGLQGTLLFPTFDFKSWTENHYFDIRETPSATGAISEVARLRSDAVRTPHPICSFAVLGKRQSEFMNCKDREAYGEHSVFALFHKLDGLILSIGVPWAETFSFQHYIENMSKAPYRRIKNFSGIYVDPQGLPKLETYSMCVRKTLKVKTRKDPGLNELVDQGVIRVAQIGDAKVHVVRAQEYFKAMSSMIKTHPEKLHFVEPPAF